VSTIGDVNAAVTSITMRGNYSVTANFALAIEIYDWYDLDAVRNNLDANYLLMNDLDSTTAGYEELASPTANAGKGWQPIGNLPMGSELNELTGIFEGQGYNIGDLFTDRLDEGFVALFRCVGETGVIKNVGVLNASVSGMVAAALVGLNCGIVSNSYSTANVTGEIAGGLVAANGGPAVATNEGTVSECYSSGLTTHTGGSGGNQNLGEESFGGLVAINGGTVSNSCSTSSVSGVQPVGGLVGYNVGTVSNSYSTGSVSGNSYVGGLVGWNSGPVSNSFWDTETSGQATSDGGTGKNTTEMKNITTFTDAGWDIIMVVNPDTRITDFTWNIVHTVTYPFLSWQPIL
jgi:hypothetical protein